MYPYDREKYEDLSYEHPNVINASKIYVLPHCILTHAVVEIFLSQKCSVIVESQHVPIRHGKHCASRVHLGTSYGKIDYNPKFIWNGKEWLLNTHGTIVFAEIELNNEEPCKNCQ